MKRVSILLVALVAALCVALPLAGCSSQDYTPEAKAQTVDDSALQSAGTLRVGVNASNAPYAAESSGSIVGIDVDIAAALADEMGLKLELVDVGTATDDAFSDEDVDIVMGVSKAGTNYKLTNPYLQSGIALFSLTEGATAPTEAGSFTVGAQSASMSAWEVTDHYGESALTNATDLQSAFESLNTGAVNYVAADGIIGQYAAHQADVEAYAIALLQDPSSYCIAYASSNTTLAQAVEEALSSISSGGITNVIEGKWLGSAQVDISALQVIQAPVAEESEESDESADESADESETDEATAAEEESSGSASASESSVD